MAVIEKYEGAGKTSKERIRYRVRYRKPDGTQTSKRGFLRKRDAELFLNTIEVSKNQGLYIDPKIGNKPVKNFAQQWLSTKQTTTKINTYQTYESRWRVHVEPRWGNVAVSKVASQDVQSWINQLSNGTAKTCIDPKTKVGKKLSPSLVSDCFTVLAGALDVAKRANGIPANPIREEVALPKRISKSKIYLTHAQVKILAESSTHPEIIYMLAYTGMRWGELTGLRLKDIDVENRRIRIERSITPLRQRNGGERFQEGLPKNGERRSIVYPKLLSDIVDENMRHKQSEDFLFTSPEGRHLRPPSSQTGWFDMAVKKSGLPKMSIHDLRHTTASLAVQAGANVKALQRMLGHSSAAMTLDVYSDLFDDDLILVADALDEAANL